MNAVHIGLSSTNASKLQTVLNVAARLLGGITKFSHISSFIKNSLASKTPRHPIFGWSLTRNCLIGSAPQYLKAYCIQVSSIPSRSTLPFSLRLGATWLARTPMTQFRSFATEGQSNWNKLHV